MKHARKILDEKALADGSIILTEDDAIDHETNEPSKVRVTMWLDVPVVTHFKTLAKKTGGKYQSLINEKLAEFCRGDFTRKITSDIVDEIYDNGEIRQEIIDILLEKTRSDVTKAVFLRMKELGLDEKIKKPHAAGKKKQA